jgi:hypothetical protein
MTNRINIDETKFIERLTTMKAALQFHIDELQNIRRLMKQFDGKVFNCRIPETINRGGKYIAYISKSSYSPRKSLRIIKKDYHTPELIRDWYISDDIFYEYTDIEGREIETNRRFNYAAFETFCKAKIQKYRQYLADVERDLLDGIQRLREAEQVARYYKQLISSFSDYTQSTYNRSFQQNYFRN